MLDSRLLRVCVIAILIGAVALLALQHREPPHATVAEIDEATSGRLPALELGQGSFALEGRVVDHEGATVGGVYLTAMQGDWLVHAVTDAMGEFEFESLHEGSLELLAIRDVLPHGQHLADVPSAAPITIRLPEPLDEPAALPRVEHAALDGNLTLAFDDSPSDYEIVLLPTLEAESGGSVVDPAPGLSGAVLRRARVDENGRFRFEALALGNYLAIVLPPWAAGGSWPQLLARPVRHTLDGQALALATQSGSISGTVLDDRGEPVPEALIEVRDGEHPGRVWLPTTSAADGTFRVPDLPAGSYRLRVAAGEARFEQLVRVSTLRDVNVIVDPLDLNVER